MEIRIPRVGNWQHRDASGIYELVDDDGREYVCGSLHVKRHLTNLCSALRREDQQRAPAEILSAIRDGAQFVARILELCDVDEDAEEIGLVERKAHWMRVRQPYWNLADAREGDAARHPPMVHPPGWTPRAIQLPREYYDPLPPTPPTAGDVALREAGERRERLFRNRPIRRRTAPKQARLLRVDVNEIYTRVRRGSLPGPDTTIDGRSAWSGYAAGSAFGVIRSERWAARHNVHLRSVADVIAGN